MIGRRALQNLLDEYDDCERCPLLCESRIQPVFGSGSTKADIVIVGEAPGAHEDEEGLPFVGKSGKLLLQLLEMAWPDHDERIIDLRRYEDDEAYFRELRSLLEQHIFFTNAVICRPGENRTPSTEELKNCRERLHRTIYAIDPVLIIAAGKIAASTVLGKNVAILQKRGVIFDVAIQSPATGRKVRYPMLAVLHPSYLLRKGDKTLVKNKKGDTYLTIGDIRYGLSILEHHYTYMNKSFPE